MLQNNMKCSSLDVFSYEEMLTSSKDQNKVFTVTFFIFLMVVLSFFALEIYLNYIIVPEAERENSWNLDNDDYNSESEETFKIDQETRRNTQFNKSVGKMKFKLFNPWVSIDNWLDRKNKNITDFQSKYWDIKTNAINNNTVEGLKDTKNKKASRYPLLRINLDHEKNKFTDERVAHLTSDTLPWTPIKKIVYFDTKLKA